MFNEGRNETIHHVIEYLYNLRLKLNKDKNPAQVVIKLFMASMYGKTIIKPIETDTIMKSSQHDFEKYVPLNDNSIDSVLAVSRRYYVKKVKSVLSHYNYVHAGVETLSMSEIIMNKVFEVSSDCGVKIYYEDTDNIHPNCDDVDKIVEKYKGKYNQNLVGTGL